MVLIELPSRTNDGRHLYDLDMQVYALSERNAALATYEKSTNHAYAKAIVFPQL